jgi:hypothetical protein
MEKIQMPAGRYYVGDLCYLLVYEWGMSATWSSKTIDAWRASSHCQMAEIL